LIVAERSKDIPSHSITDPRLLMDKIIAAFTRGDFAAAVEAADQLARIEPDLYEAQKARVVSRFIVSHLPNQEDADWELLDEIMDHLQEFNSNDPELLDVWVMVKTRAMRDPSALPEIVEILKSRPESKAMGFYVEASQVRGDKKEWSIATVDQAIALIDESLRLDAQEERFQKSKAQLLKIKADLAQGKKSNDWGFSFNFGARFDLD
jgi:tetratricopeptide (TPR) repeat protein